MSSASSPRGFKADTGLTYVEAESIAARLRRMLHLDPATAIEGHDLLVRLKDYLRVGINGRPVEVDYDVQNVDIEAFATFDEAVNRFVIMLDTATYRRLTGGDGRALFDVAHEAGHVIRHKEMLVRMSRIPHRRAILQRDAEPDHPSYMDTEWQADAIASALLMPALAMDALAKENGGKLHGGLVRARFGVSSGAAAVRIGVFEGRRAKLLGG